MHVGLNVALAFNSSQLWKQVDKMENSFNKDMMKYTC